MSDPNNVFHDQKVAQEKKDRGEPTIPDDAAHLPQPGKKTPHEPDPRHQSHGVKREKAAASDAVGDDDAAE